MNEFRKGYSIGDFVQHLLSGRHYMQSKLILPRIPVLVEREITKQLDSAS
jgi:hypothetical protein